MMKKIGAILLALFLLLPLTPVFAEGEAALHEIRITTPVPKHKGTPNGMENPAVDSVTMIKDGETLTVPADQTSLVSFVWTDETGNPAIESFTYGTKVTLTVTLSVAYGEEWTVAGESRALVNGEEASMETFLEGEKRFIRVSASFEVEAGSLLPEIRIYSDGETVRAFNGEETEISIRLLDQHPGAVYLFQWSRNGIALDGKTEQSIKVRNVSDSGTYSCQVLASLGDSISDPVSSTTLEVAITPLNVTLLLDDAEKNVGDPDPRFTYTTEPKVPDYLIGAPARVQGEVEGTYDILVGTLSFGDEAKENYTLLVKNGKFTIRGRGSVAYAPADAIADESYIHGKNSSTIKIRVSKGSVPENARFHLTPADPAVEEAIRAKSSDEILKSFAVSLVGEDSKETSLLSGAHLKVQIPLTAEEEGTADYIYPVQYDPETGSLYRFDSEIVEIGEAKYISFETETIFPCALLRAPVPVPHLEPGEEPGDPVKPAGTWVWVLILVPGVLALGVILFAIFYNKRKNAPKNPPLKKNPSPKKAPAAPPRPAAPAKPAPEKTTPEKAPEEESPRKKKIVSFDDLDD